MGNEVDEQIAIMYGWLGVLRLNLNMVHVLCP
jgi:hypothetical protein